MQYSRFSQQTKTHLTLQSCDCLYWNTTQFYSKPWTAHQDVANQQQYENYIYVNGDTGPFLIFSIYIIKIISLYLYTAILGNWYILPSLASSFYEPRSKSVDLQTNTIRHTSAVFCTAQIKAATKLHNSDCDQTSYLIKTNK